MTPATLVPQTAPAASVRQIASGMAWGDELQIHRQRPPRPDQDLFRALYDSQKQDAITRVDDPRRLTSVDERRISDYLLATTDRVKLRRAVTSRPRNTVPPAIARLELSKHQIRRATQTRLRRADAQRRVRAYDRFQLFNQWEGHVVDVGPHDFRAIIESRRGQARRVTATFPVRLVRRVDLPLLEVGSPFYYCVGRFIYQGQPSPGSILWLRRLTPSSEATTELLRRGEAWMSRIGWTD
jgi:hypothetical protein